MVKFWCVASIGVFILLWKPSLGQSGEVSEIDSLVSVLRSCSAQDSLQTIEKLSALLPFDSAQYGLKLAENALAIALEKADPSFEAQFLFYNGLFQERLGELDSAREFYEKSASVAQTLNDQAMRIKSSLGAALIIHKKGNYDLAEKYLDTLRMAAESYGLGRTDDQVLYYKVLDIMADNHYFKGEYDTAIQWYKTIAGRASESGHQEYQANAYKGISAVYTSTGRLHESIDYGHKALFIFESNQDLKQMGLTLTELGRAYSKLSQYDKALEFHQRSLAINERRGDKSGMSVSYQNIGVVHSRQKNYGLALEHYEKSRALKEELGIDRGMSAISINMGLLHKRMGEYQEAESYYFDGLMRAETTGSATYRSNALQNLTSLYLSWSKFNEARKYGHLALDAASAQNSILGLSTAYYNLQEAYKGLGDYKNAYEYFTISVQYDDSLMKQSNASEIQRIENEYTKAAEERQIELTEQQLALLAAEERLASNEKLLLVASAAVIIMALIFLLRYVILRSRRERSDMEYERDKHSLESKLTAQELEYQKLQNEHDRLQLSMLSKEIMEKNEKLSQLEDDLDRLTKDYISDEAKERKGLAETVLSHGRNGEEWVRFMQYFRNVYHDYLDRLKSEFTEITANELRLCALIKINLSTKEIASALNITPESLRTAKYRLRKKLNLENEHKLTDFLLRY